MYRLLEGMRVVEASAFIAAPLGGMTLAQLGAEVIRCDPPGGGVDSGRWPLTADGRSLYWAGLNKGKRSVCIDTREPEGREILAALVTAPGEGGGLFLTNLPALGPLGYESLRERRTDLIMLRITGHPDGSTAVDYTVNAAVGVPLATGPAGSEAPVNHVLPAWDIATGLTAATGILAAERRRRRSGEGSHLQLALSDVAHAMVGTLGHIGEAWINQSERVPDGNFVYGAFGRDFATRDGRRFMVVAVTERQWRSLCEATGTAEEMAGIEAGLGVDLRDEGQRFEARDAIAAVLERWASRHDFEQVREALEAARACWGPYQSFLQMAREDPRCSVANPLFEEVEQPGIGRYPMPGSPLQIQALAREPVAPAPLLGEHTDRVLAEILGLSDVRIGELRARGVVA